MSRRSYLDKDWESARKHAADAFKHHQVTKEADNRWLFARPNTGIYHMRVLAAPRMVMCYGDIGSLIMIPSDGDGFHWLASVLAGHGTYDPCYIAEKVPREMCITDFSMERVRECVKRLRADIDEHFPDGPQTPGYANHCSFVASLEEHSEFESAWEFYDAVYRLVGRFHVNNIVDEGPPAVEGLTQHFFFQLEAFRYFFMRFPEAT